MSTPAGAASTGGPPGDRRAGSAQPEYAGLEWSRVDLSAGTIAVERALDHDDRELGDVKTVTRTIGLPSCALDMRRAHNKRQIEERLAAGRLSEHPGWVEQAFRQTYESIKPVDGIIIGIYDKFSDQPAEDAAFVRRYGSLSRTV